MNPERYRRIGELYHEALDLEPEQREPFLREACAGDTDLFEEVASLIAAHDEEPEFLAEPLLLAATTEAPPADTRHNPKVCPRCGTRYSELVVVCAQDGEILDDDPEALVGTTLDGIYRVEALIGRGGMATVYRARHLLLDDDVAIKMLPTEARRSAAWLRRFQREGRAARRFRHPNAVTVHELRIASDGLAYMVLEYVEGETLRAELHRRGVLAAAEALAILEQIAGALDAAHAAGVVHRDVKPENVMLAGAPDGLKVVKLLDLGIAKLFETGEATGPLTFAGQIVGTPAYMSPEQWGEPQRDGRRDVDGRTDVYSVGILAYELFAGRVPFLADSHEAIRRLHVSAPPPEMSRAGRPIPEAVREAIGRALSKDRADRHATVGAFVAELGAALRGTSAPVASASAAATDPGGATVWGTATTEGVAGDTEQVAPPPNNLPTEATSFVGRGGQAEEVERLQAPGRLVTLTGMGGIGKTRLALRVARAALAAREEEVWFVELAALSDPSLVADTVARAVGAREAAAGAPLDALGEALATRSALLVLDNCEHLVEESRRVAGALLAACPRLRVLATSREPIGLAGEVVWRVPALDVCESGVTECDAVRLFVERAAVARPAFALAEQNATLIADLCRRLEGIPLAIELAAARVKVLSVEQIAARMANRFTLLRGGSEAVPARQRALRATIDWSYELLDEAERVLMRRVSVFAGGLTIDAAEAVCSGEGIDIDDVLDLLVGLVDKSFVVVTEQRGEARYGMVDTLRQYAAERLRDEDDSARLAARHRDWYFGLAERSEAVPAAERGAWFDRLAADLENVRAALRGCLDGEGDADRGLRAVISLDHFWRARGYVSEGLGWIEAFLERAPDAAPALRAAALRSGGYLAKMKEDHARAAALLEESVRLARVSDDPAGLAASLKSLSGALANLGDFERAEALGRESLSLCLALGDQKSIAAALDRLANLAWNRDDMERARDLWYESLSGLRELGDRLNCAVVLTNLAHLEAITGNAEAHERCARECAEVFRELGYSGLLGHALVELGLAAAARGDVAGAVAAYEEALQTARGGDDRIWALPALEAVACLAASSGETQRALRLGACVEATDGRLRIVEPRTAVAWYERQMAPARAAVGDAEAARLAAEGRAMSVERAIEYALAALQAIRRRADESSTTVG